MIDFNRYKTYDTSTGYGNADQWRNGFKDRGKYFSFATEEKVDEKEEKIKLEKCKDVKELNREFRKLMLIHHPDIAGDTKENTEITQKIIARYERLKKKLK